MIWDSKPWKSGLMRDALALASFEIAEGNDEAGANFEKIIFVSALAIRKLLEAQKLTSVTACADVKCCKLPLKSKSVPNLLDWHRIHDFYDGARLESGTVTLKFFVNQIMHSFVFGPFTEEGNDKVGGFFVASDKDRTRFLYRYDISEVVRVMRLIALDDVKSMRWTRDLDGNLSVENIG